MFRALLLWGPSLLPLERYSRRFPGLPAFRRCATHWILSSGCFENCWNSSFSVFFSFMDKWRLSLSLFLSPTTSCPVPTTQDGIHSWMNHWATPFRTPKMAAKCPIGGNFKLSWVGPCLVQSNFVLVPLNQWTGFTLHSASLNWISATHWIWCLCFGYHVLSYVFLPWLALTIGCFEGNFQQP